MQSNPHTNKTKLSVDTLHGLLYTILNRKAFNVVVAIDQMDLNELSNYPHLFFCTLLVKTTPFSVIIHLLLVLDLDTLFGI